MPRSRAASTRDGHSPRCAPAAQIPARAPEPHRVSRNGFERLAAVFARRISVSPSPRRDKTSPTSSINSTSSVGSMQEETFISLPEHREFCPRPREEGLRPSVRLRHRHSLHSMHVDAPSRTDTLPPPPPPATERSPGSSGSSTPFLPNVSRDKLNPTQRQMYDRLRLVNEQLLQHTQLGHGPAPDTNA